MLPLAPRVVLTLFVTAFGITSTRCTTNGWYDPITGNRLCAAAPPAIERWSTQPRLE